MARTYRSVPDYIRSNEITPYIYKEKRYFLCTHQVRVENRKARDGSGNHYVCGSATEGVFNYYHDVGPNYGKRTANKDIRRWHKSETKRQLKEHYDYSNDLRIELEALEQEIEDYYNDLDEDDYFMDQILEANQDYWESKYDEYLEDIDE